MAKTSKAFEQFVEQFETMLTGTGLDLRANVVLRDVHTGQKRPVDLLLGLPGAPVADLILVESRQNYKLQDVKWIEHLAMKQFGLGVRRTVAIARQGFTAAAELKAAAVGIEIRTVASLDLGIVSGWFDETFPQRPSCFATLPQSAG